MMMSQDLDDDGDAGEERNPYLYEKERSYSEAIIQSL